MPDGSTQPNPDSSAVRRIAPARNTLEEPTVEFIHALARDGLSKFGHHGPMTAMGIPRSELPHWDDLQIMTAQLATKLNCRQRIRIRVRKRMRCE